MTTAKCDAAKRDAAKCAPTNPATRLGAHIIMAAKQLCDECDMAKWVHAGPATAMGAHIITAAKNDAAKQRCGETRRDEVGPTIKLLTEWPACHALARHAAALQSPFREKSPARDKAVWHTDSWHAGLSAQGVHHKQSISKRPACHACLFARGMAQAVKYKKACVARRPFLKEFSTSCKL